jgi:uncharacterized integral membrane protein (TIGR00698 family)
MTALTALFILLSAACLSPWASPALALILGIAFALLFEFEPPPSLRMRHLTKVLLQASVVGLGFGMNLRQVVRAGIDGFAYTGLSIAFALVLGWLLGRLFKTGRTASYLLSVGTAICGGSAIAAVGPVLGANQEEMSVALAAVFLLNAIALLVFPPIGRALGLGQGQFGLWAALAIHDTSAVVGASLKYGAGALAVATTVKLARALWIVPISLGTAARKRSNARVQYPWFILLFGLAAGVATSLPSFSAAWAALDSAAKAGLTLTLFWIGAGISRGALRRAGLGLIAQAVLLWVAVAAGSLALIRAGVIR